MGFYSDRQRGEPRWDALAEGAGQICTGQPFPGLAGKGSFLDFCRPSLPLRHESLGGWGRPLRVLEGCERTRRVQEEAAGCRFASLSTAEDRGGGLLLWYFVQSNTSGLAFGIWGHSAFLA